MTVYSDSKYKFESFLKTHLPKYPGEIASTGYITSARIFSYAGSPTTSHDNRDSAGISAVFQKGDIWLDLTNGRLYFCTDASQNAAIWIIFGSEDGLVGLKEVDETNLTSGSFAWYNSTTGKFEYNVRYDDLRVPFDRTMLAGVSNPTFEKWIDNGSGSHGLYLYSFAKNAANTLAFIAQLPHNYKEGSPLYPHVHWSTNSGSDTGDVVWTLEYAIKNNNAAFSTTSTIITKTEAASGTANYHQKTFFDAIDGTGLKISSIMVGRIERTVKLVGAGGYDDKVWGLEFDLHYQIDSVGSATQSTK